MRRRSQAEARTLRVKGGGVRAPCLCSLTTGDETRRGPPELTARTLGAQTAERVSVVREWMRFRAYEIFVPERPSRA